MLLFDAIVAGLIFKYFGEQGLIVLAITCCVMFLRLGGRVGNILNMLQIDFEEIEEEDK